MLFGSSAGLYKVILSLSNSTRRYMSSSAGPVESRLNRVLSQKFDPTFLRIYNESHRHNQKIGIETHFRVVIVSHHFNNLSPVQRERLVYKSVEHELQSGVHALSVIARAIDEPLDIHTSPPCQKSLL
ncbi:unnamed protein product [Schistosoma rodhaini]|nr:unnamed protein product [Schistosoma rodhaini]